MRGILAAIWVQGNHAWWVLGVRYYQVKLIQATHQFVNILTRVDICPSKDRRLRQLTGTERRMINFIETFYWLGSSAASGFL